MSSPRKTSAPAAQPRPAKSKATAPAGAADAIQGEGDYRSAERYDQSAQAFAKSGKVEEAARRARPANADEARELRAAEDQGLSHSKGEDPALPHASRGASDRR